MGLNHKWEGAQRISTLWGSYFFFENVYVFVLFVLFFLGFFNFLYFFFTVEGRLRGLRGRTMLAVCSMHLDDSECLLLTQNLPS